MPDFVNTETAELSRISDDTLLLRFKSEVYVELHHAKEIDQEFMKMVSGKSHYFIVDARDIESNMSNEASKYLSKESDIGRFTYAAAIILNSLPIRLTASFFIKFQKPIYPTKIFGNEEEALNWFESLKKTG